MEIKEFNKRNMAKQNIEEISMFMNMKERKEGKVLKNENEYQDENFVLGVDSSHYRKSDAMLQNFPQLHLPMFT